MSLGFDKSQEHKPRLGLYTIVANNQNQRPIQESNTEKKQEQVYPEDIQNSRMPIPSTKWVAPPVKRRKE